jgi:hypothetical protein
MQREKTTPKPRLVAYPHMAGCNPAELDAHTKSFATAENSWLRCCLIFINQNG